MSAMERRSGDPPRKLRGLGRGLDALLPAPAPPRPAEAGVSSDVFSCALDKITPQRGQPRQHFDTAALEELAQSIRDHGMIEPLVVRRVAGSDRFELVAGERRWRAAQRAGLREVLVVVRELTPQEAFELALIENVQREDLDPIDFAEALQRLLDEHGYTQESLARRVGKDRSTIANALRLLRLPGAVRARIRQGDLTEGHARALLGAPSDAALVALAEKVVRGRLSVRQTEALVRSSKTASRDHKTTEPAKSAGTRDLERRLAQKFGTRCEVRDRGGAGTLVIRYSSLDELDRLLDLLL